MTVILWVLQIPLALHTVVGGVWKFTNSEQAVPSLGAIPHGLWLGLGALELLCAVGLVLPAVNRSLGTVAAVAAAIIAAEMLLFCVVHLASGASDYGPMMYWLVVAVIAGFIAWGRFASNAF